MELTRRHVKRPLAITLIAVGYFLFPVLGLLQVAYLYEKTPSGISELFGRLNLHSYLTMVLSVAVGYAVLQVRAWGFYLFLVHAAFTVGNNIYIYRDSHVVPLYLVILFNVLLLGLVGFFLLTSIRTPYFNPRLRWWEQKQRRVVDLAVTLRWGDHSIDGRTSNLSESGALIECNVGPEVPQEGASCEMELRSETERVTMHVSVVRRGRGEDWHSERFSG